MMHPHNPLLKIENLQVNFRGDETVARAVGGVSFHVGRQEIVCLVGESGCGKTITALSILGLVPTPPGEIAAGRIFFEDNDLLQLTEHQQRHIRGNHIAMVFQEPLTSLNPVFTIGDQIGEAIQTHQPTDKNRLKEKCIALLADVGLPSPAEQLNSYPHQLSGGQRQRAMIAMALACGPDLIIADEPTTALDVTVQAQIIALFQSLQRTRAMSVLYITHDLGVVAEIADRVYVMYAGRIMEQGSAHTVFRHASHPYTQALLASLPDRSKRGQRLYSIPGSVPNPAYLPVGCPFHPRCPHEQPSCREGYPSMCDYGEDHLARCPVLFAKV
jgi:peptide/nickel transport system ATP-binding protein/oligopeptide transport system ATP-binding protein